MKTYNGMYLGIVIQNNDPERRGRLKIYIPHISYNVYEKWYKENTDKSWNFPGRNVNSDINDIIEPLKKALPWSECAAPLAGANSSGRYNAHLERSTISDGSNINLTTPTDAVDYDESSEFNINTEAIAEAPGKKYELEYYRAKDAFTTTLSGDIDQPNRVNKYTYTYKPETYSNKTKGSFSVPNVGAHIWCFFEEGDPSKAVYFASSFGSSDWDSIYGDTDAHIDYPSTYENVSISDDPNYNINTETYRNKYVINQRAGALEFVNTDNREILKLSHYSGSFKEFTNNTSIEFASTNDQRLVMEDSFDTVRGFRNIFTERDLEYLTKGDQYIKVGKLNKALYEQWATEASELADIKQLFETKRAEKIDHEILKKTSRNQERSGTFAPCPVCGNGNKLDKRDSLYRSLANMERYNNSNYWRTIHGEPVRVQAYNEVTDSLTSPNKSYGSKTSKGTGFIVHINDRNHSWTKRGEDESSNTGIDGNTYTTGPGFVFGELCPVCEGTGLSPSTMGGTWDVDTLKESNASGTGNFDKLLQKTAKKLFEIEKKMGVGGSIIEYVAKHKTESIGLHMNDFGSIRIDDVGKISRNKVTIHPGGVFNEQAPSPIVEYVHVDDLPGGNYTLNVCNKWNVQVGSGGISMKSFGAVDISGTITNVAGDQVNIGSENEINIDGGKRVSITADMITLRQRNREQVLVDSNLGVSQNLVVGGGAHIEGELSVNHITAPVEIQETDPMVVFGQLLEHLSFRCIISGGSHTDSHPGDNHPYWGNATITLIKDSNHDNVRMYPHTHHFRNLPLNLKSDNDAVRADAMDNNKPIRREAKSTESVPYHKKVNNDYTTDSTDGIDT